MNIIRIKIDVTKLDKTHFFRPEGKSAVYADITLLPNKNGDPVLIGGRELLAGKYGDHYMVVQDIGKEARERGEKGPIIGNAKEIQRQSQAQTGTAAKVDPETDDVPF